MQVHGFDQDPEGVVQVRAPNPSALTLDGTNTYVVGRWVIDPGPADPGHLDAVRAAAGTVEGVVLTHGHADHAEGADALGAPVLRPGEGEEAGPFRALATPGHSADSVCLIWEDRVGFTGDTVLGAGSVFIAPGEGTLSEYLSSLRRLRELDLEVLCPGHGPYVWDPRAKLDEYVAHRLDRERRLVAALDAGLRTTDELLDAAWPDAPAQLRYFASLSLASHLEKLEEEGRLPAGVERPASHST
jgi:glyoxylase-like metal-dependent hydrolase (beta-lactamase superfamily II)